MNPSSTRRRAGPTFGLIILFVALAGWMASAADVDLAVIVQDPDGNLSLFRFPDDETDIRIRFGGADATFGIITATCLYLDDARFSASGPFSGEQLTTVNALYRTVEFVGPGAFSSVTVSGDMLASLSFNGTGVFTEGFETDATCEDGVAYVQFVVDLFAEMWIEVLGGFAVNGPPPEPPRLRLVAMEESTRSAPAGGGGAMAGGGSETILPPDGVGIWPTMTGGHTVSLFIRNVGNSPAVAPITIKAGPAYGKDWIPDADLFFFQQTITEGMLQARETNVFEVTVPPIPADVAKTFDDRRTYYGSYIDKDPEQDYLGIVVQFSNGNQVVAFVALDGVVETLSGAKKQFSYQQGGGDG